LFDESVINDLLKNQKIKELAICGRTLLYYNNP